MKELMKAQLSILFFWLEALDDPSVQKEILCLVKRRKKERKHTREGSQPFT